MGVNRESFETNIITFVGGIAEDFRQKMISYLNLDKRILSTERRVQTFKIFT